MAKQLLEIGYKANSTDMLKSLNLITKSSKVPGLIMNFNTTKSLNILIKIRMVL